jgi:UDP-2,3-diacylglucosamine hydrolase
MTPKDPTEPFAPDPTGVWFPEWVKPLLDRSSPAGRTLFVSDLHWGAGPDLASRVDEMNRLLEGLPGRIDDLIFGGDTFEFWWEWKHAIPRAHWDFLHAVRKVSDAGVRVRFIAGNHDFAVGASLSDICRAQVHPDGFCLDIGGAKWLFVHGDAVPPSERMDRVVRKILRSPAAQWFWNLLHPDIAIPMAMFVGKGSRLIESGPAPSTIEMEPLMRGWMRDRGLSGVVHGHSHRPLLTTGEDGTYVNNGDWVRMRTAVWIEPGHPARLVDCEKEGFPWLSNT